MTDAPPDDRQPDGGRGAHWPDCLSDDDLAKLSGRLDAAVRDIDVLSLPTPDLAEITAAAAHVRITLRRRHARRRLDAAREALAEAGWSA